MFVTKQKEEEKAATKIKMFANEEEEWIGKNNKKIIVIT